MTILVADSGSTKTDWMLARTAEGSPLHIATVGMNPCLMDDATILSILRRELCPTLSATLAEWAIERVDSIFFYGAGCRPDQIQRMERLLGSVVAAERISVASDLLGAAHALCGDAPGIIAILGTGSGSAVYDGKTFTLQTPSLGYILGDEGSGASLGKHLLADVMKQQLPPHIIDAFRQRYDMSVAEIIERVYRQPAPNRFLAQFTRFLADYRYDEAVHDLIVSEFRAFLKRNVVPYHRTDLSVNFVGSIASVFRSELEQAFSLSGLQPGRFMPSPIEALLKYHLETTK